MADYREEAPALVRDFLRYEKKNKDHSDSTIDEYYLDLRTFFRFMMMERGTVAADTTFEDICISDINLDFIKGISKIDINNYIDYLRSDRIINEKHGSKSAGLSSATTNRRIACLKSFFKYLCEAMELLGKNPTVGVSSPMKHKSLPAYLTENECIRLLDALKGINQKRDYAIIMVFLNCGLRVSELVDMDIGDIREDGEFHFINIIGKGQKERQVYLAPSCISAIADYMTEREQIEPEKGSERAMFLSRKRNRISVDAVQAMVKKAIKQAGLNEKKYSVHKLRHTAATLMLQNGVDVRTLQVLLGHKSLSTTQIYAHCSSDQLKEAALINPLSNRAKANNGQK